MMMPKLKNPVAAIVLLALAASTALRCRSWLFGPTEEYNIPSEFRRTLTNKNNKDPTRPPHNHDTDTFYDQMWWKLKKRGIDPNSDQFERILRDRVLANEQQMMNAMITHSSGSDSPRDKWWRALLSKGIEPSRPKFRNMYERKVAQEEEKERREWLRRDLHEKADVWARGKQNRMHRVEEVFAASDKFTKHRSLVRDPSIPFARPGALMICERKTGVLSVEDPSLVEVYGQCPEFTKDKPIILLEGSWSHGQTGNNLVEFLHAIQKARDEGVQLGMHVNSWALELLVSMFTAIESDDWQEQIEQRLCVKIFQNNNELEGWDVIEGNGKDLLHYRSEAPLGDYMESQMYSLRTLFRDINTGEGRTLNGGQILDMCSGMKTLFGKTTRKYSLYSVIHSRILEGEPGTRLLETTSERSGCDPVAALEMRPDYVKSILEPLGMLDYPIVFISDGQDPAVLERLKADPDIGPKLRTVPEEASWVGGDLTLGIMSNVFIGNPVSTFSGFIAKTRLALGIGHSYLFRAKDEDGEWETVCGDHCVFDKSILESMS